MKNTYEREVKAQCPVKPDDRDRYDFVIESATIIKVEDINAFFDAHAGEKSVFQETLTAKCATTLGAKVTSVGYHSGVKVTCVAP